MDDLEQLREDLLDASLIIDNEGLVRGYGHVSARLPGSDSMLITPRRGLGLLSDPDEMLVVDFDGELIEGDGNVAIESPVHGAIYRARSDVMAIVRTQHSTYANVLGILGKPARPVHGFGTFLGAEVPIYPKIYLIVDKGLGDEVASTLGQAEAVILRGNGAVVTGRTVQEATVKSIFLEESCQLQYLALCAGEPTYVGADEMAIRREPGYDHFGRAWEYFRERLMMELELEE